MFGCLCQKTCNVHSWMAWCKTELNDFFRWFFSFKSAWIFACAFQFSSRTFSCIFLADLHFVSEKNKTDLSDFFRWIFSSKSAWIFEKEQKRKKILRSKHKDAKDHKYKCLCSALLRSLCMLWNLVLLFLKNKVQTSHKNTGECFTT